MATGTQSKQVMLLVDYASLDTNPQKAVRKIQSEFEKNNLMVTSVEVAPKPVRRGSYTFKNVHLGFSDKQTVTFGVTTSGNIFQVKINGKDFAVHDQVDQRKSIAEIVERLNAGRSAWQKKLVAIKEPAATQKIKTSLKRQIENAKNRRDEAQKLIEESGQALQAKRDSLQAIQSNVTTVQSEIADLTAKIASKASV